MTIVCGGSSNIPLFGPPASISPSGQQLHHFSEVCPQIRGDSVVRMWVQLEEMACVVLVGVAEGA